jgi:hypothetical protein
VTYLILKISGYLVLALLAGLATGWFLRHITATSREEEMQRTLADARARVPQFETLIRSRDVQISHLKEEIKDKNFRINALVDDLRAAETALKDAHGNSGNGAATQPPERNDQVSQLKRQLEEACAQAADAMSVAAAAESELIQLKAERARVSEAPPHQPSAEQHPEPAGRFKQTDAEFIRLRQDLELEQRRVLELERERELQNKSLQVLHQQLELEREQRQRSMGD